MGRQEEQKEAEKGKANRALGEVLARALGVRRSQVELVAGPTSSEKKFLVRGVAVEEVAARVRAMLAGLVEG